MHPRVGTEMTHLHWWSRSWLLVSTSGLGLATCAWGPVRVAATLLVIATVVAALVALLVAAVRAGSPDLVPSRLWQSRSQLRSWRMIATVAMSTAQAVVAAAAAFWLSPDLAWSLLVTAAVTSPWFWTAIHRRDPSRGAGQTRLSCDRTVGAVAEGTHSEVDGARHSYEADQCPATTVRSMSDQELCRAFRRSCVLLDRADEPYEQLRLVVLREAYLNEMSRRDPAGFAVWLASGARAAS